MQCYSWLDIVVWTLLLDALLRTNSYSLTLAGRNVEPAFQNIAGQMAAIKAMRARTRLLPPGALPARERAVQRIDEGFWRQARSMESLLQC